MNLKNDGVHKILLFKENLAAAYKTEGVVILAKNGVHLYVVPELSDATQDQIMQYNKVLNKCKSSTNATKNICMQSIVCDIDMTCVLYILGANLKTCDTDTINMLCLYNARTQKMLDLEEIGHDKILIAAESSFKKRMAVQIERFTYCTEEISAKIVRQYCWKYGNLNFTGWAEKVFVENFLQMARKYS